MHLWLEVETGKYYLFDASQVDRSGVNFEELAELLVWHSNLMYFNSEEEHRIDEVLWVVGEQRLMQVESLQVSHGSCDALSVFTAEHLDTFRHYLIVKEHQ